MTQSVEYDVIVIGGGPAGLAAAIEAYRHGAAKVLILEREKELGGILLQCIHNGFGLHYFKEELTGPEYAGRFVRQVKELGISYKTDTMVLEITPERTVIAQNSSEGIMALKAKAIVLAMGCRERSRGALMIAGYRPAGVFTAGTAQRYMNIEGYMPGKKVVILGSGDIGLIMARRMTLEGAEVKLVCELMPYSGGLARNIVQCLEDYDIPLKFSHTITKIHGKNRVEGVTVCAVDENRRPIKETAEFIECDTVLLSVGLIPENELSKQVNIRLDPATSGPVVNEFMETSAEGFFACGNAVHVHDLVDFVTRESMQAGKNAALYAQGLIKKCSEPILVKAGEKVRYTVPQVIFGTEHPQDISIFFRSVDVYKNVEVQVYNDNRLIKKIKKPVVTPGEMQNISVSPNLIEKDSKTIQVCLVSLEGEK